MKNRIGTACLVLGVILILSALLLYVYNTTEDSRAGEYSADILKELVGIIEDSREEPEDSYTASSVPTAVVDGKGYIGYIYMPTLEELELPIMAEWSYEGLKKAPCRYSGSVAEGNLVLLGHNYTMHFGKLSRLVQGDKVYFTDISGRTYVYEVVGIDVLGETDIEAMTSGEYALSLFTCDYSGKNRLTVRLIRIEA